MPAALMDGAAVAQRSLDETRCRVASYRAAAGRGPRLATVQVGDDTGVHASLRTKVTQCHLVGIEPVRHELPSHSTTADVVGVVAELVADEDVDGIVVQHPLPPHIDRHAVFGAICPSKDVDGASPVGSSHGDAAEVTFTPCAPAGILELLDAYEVPIAGRHIVVVVQDTVLGRPAAKLLLERDATVTICHARTRGLDQVVGEADVVVAAIGRPGLIRGAWIKPGAVVVDASDNACGTGDVAFEAAAERASLITTLREGVGPLTVARLLSQTVSAAEQRHG